MEVHLMSRSPFRGVRLLVLDVDGVLTDGGLLYGSGTGVSRRFHVRDGLGIRRLLDTGIGVAWISGRVDDALQTRARELGVEIVVQAEDKLLALRNIVDHFGITLQETAFLGDDLLDLPALLRCGLPMAVADADPAVRQAARFVSLRNGGDGAVREVCDRILEGLKRVVGVIPARYGSSRFPGKPLALIAGVPMVVRVARQARKAAFDEVIVATDDVRILAACEEQGVHAVMTSSLHHTGTERMAEVARARKGDIWVNIQGDEPLLSPILLHDVVQALEQDPAADIATARTWCTDLETLARPDSVKVVTSETGSALYFSRHPIPFQREGPARGGWVHVGIYAYRREALLAFAGLPTCDLEKAESLEQLRALYHGMRIQVVDTYAMHASVDAPGDIAQVERLLALHGEPG